MGSNGDVSEVTPSAVIVANCVLFGIAFAQYREHP